MSKEFVTKDSGERQEFPTGSRRDAARGKGRYDLVPTLPLQRLAQLYERGAEKYGERNWERGQPLMRYIDSAMRHLNNLKAGEPEEDHATAVAWNVFGYIHTLNEIEAGRLPKELDDRPPPEPQYDPRLAKDSSLVQGHTTPTPDTTGTTPALDPRGRPVRSLRELLETQGTDRPSPFRIGG